MVTEELAIPLSQEQSLVARAVRARKGVIVNDVLADSGFLPNPLLPETRSEMAIPIIIGSDVLGVLDVQADSVDRFSDEDIQIQTTLASQTAVALQNARQIEQTRAALADATMFRQLADASSQGIAITTLTG
jgi:GAF domain-containing protein